MGGIIVGVIFLVIAAGLYIWIRPKQWPTQAKVAVIGFVTVIGLIFVGTGALSTHQGVSKGPVVTHRVN